MANRHPVVSRHRGLNLDWLDGGVAGGLVHQHQGQVPQRRPKRGVVGGLVAQGGQPRGGQWVVDDAHIHPQTLCRREPKCGRVRRNRMLADTDAIRSLGSASAAHAADLAAIAATLSSLPDPATASMFGAVGARFLAALADAVATEARAVAALSDRFSGADITAHAAAIGYDDADLRAGGWIAGR